MGTMRFHNSKSHKKLGDLKKSQPIHKKWKKVCYFLLFTNIVQLIIIINNYIKG